MQNKNVLYVFIVIVILALGIWFGFFNKKNSNVPPPEDTKTKITYTNASDYLITVDAPLPNAVVGKNFSVTGKSRGVWFFEASFPIELRDNNNNLLTTVVAQAQGDWMTENFVPFSANIIVPNSYTGPATLVLKKDNPSGDPTKDASISFPITIQ